jgi:hypothetical protein
MVRNHSLPTPVSAKKSVIGVDVPPFAYKSNHSMPQLTPQSMDSSQMSTAAVYNGQEGQVQNSPLYSMSMRQPQQHVYQQQQQYHLQHQHPFPTMRQPGHRQQLKAAASALPTYVHHQERGYAQDGRHITRY